MSLPAESDYNPLLQQAQWNAQKSLRTPGKDVT